MENRNSNYGANYRKDNNGNKYDAGREYDNGVNLHYEERGKDEGYYMAPRAKSNTPLIVLAIVLAIIAMTASAVAVTLIIKPKPEKEEKTAEVGRLIPQEQTQPTETETTNENEDQNSESRQEDKGPVVPEKVVKTMYVDCNENLTLRKGPGTDYDAILLIPVGEEVGFIKDAGNNFAKVKYNGTEGYVSMSYLSNVKPYVWEYNNTEVEGFVEDVLYAYVDSINADDVTILTQYLSGNAVQEAYKTHEAVTGRTNREEVISVNCHSVKRISKTQVTVVRESTIRVYRHNGEIKDVYEKYLTTVENNGNGMHVIAFKAM